mmetsp:Transcript_52381/g.125445  ORF Transcript_52381/g.125445 Transcript_52381/m.125445 type:complete len:214 (-) Transcript_52381:127-768(-)
MVVKLAMSEKNMVTLRSETSMLASASFRIISCTTGQGTYLPQERMAVFMLSNRRRSNLISLETFWANSRLCVVAELVAASCSRVMLSTSSASSTSGFKRFLDKYVRSRVRRLMPMTMRKRTTHVVIMESRAVATVSARFRNSATASVLSSRSSAVISWLSKSGYRINSRSICRYSEDMTSTSTSSSLFVCPHTRASLNGASQRRSFEPTKELQ